MDKHLEEQLERVRQLSARVGQIHERLAENTELMTRDRERSVGSPLAAVRNFGHHGNGAPVRRRRR